MIRRSPSRNQRSKSIKIKHVLQIILLLGICFWLIYQVKHSNDKKKEFHENDAKESVATQTAYQLPKLGRKGLYPYKDEVNQNEKNEEEAEDENIVEDDENMHEHNEQEEGNEHETEGKKGSNDEVRKGEEQEEDERGGGDDEIDENDPENSEVDTDRNEESTDEEKEKEKEGDEDNESSEDEEKEGSVENHNTHEAREEHYKGDDASSAVTHDTHTTSTETETVGLENFDVKSEMLSTKSENKPNYTEESNRNQTGSDFKVTKDELTGETSSNATSGKETGNNSLSNPVTVDSSFINNTATTYSDSHSEASSNLTVVIPGASNNITEAGANTSSEQDKMVPFSESNQAQNGTVDTTVTGEVKNVQAEGLEQGGNRVSEENLRDSNSSVPVKTENGDAAARESSNIEDGELEKTTGFVASKEGENKVNIETSETNKTQNNSNMKEEADAREDVKLKGTTKTGETNETSDSSSGNGTSDSVEHNATDSSDSHILKDVTGVRTDLDTLPDIRNEGHNGDQTATE